MESFLSQTRGNTPKLRDKYIPFGSQTGENSKIEQLVHTFWTPIRENRQKLGNKLIFSSPQSLKFVKIAKNRAKNFIILALKFVKIDLKQPLLRELFSWRIRFAGVC